jgi:hypothetical protein
MLIFKGTLFAQEPLNWVAFEPKDTLKIIKHKDFFFIEEHEHNFKIGVLNINYRKIDPRIDLFYAENDEMLRRMYFLRHSIIWSHRIGVFLIFEEIIRYWITGNTSSVLLGTGFTLALPVPIALIGVGLYKDNKYNQAYDKWLQEQD